MHDLPASITEGTVQLFADDVSHLIMGGSEQLCSVVKQKCSGSEQLWVGVSNMAQNRLNEMSQ